MLQEEFGSVLLTSEILDTNNSNIKLSGQPMLYSETIPKTKKKSIPKTK